MPTEGPISVVLSLGSAQMGSSWQKAEKGSRRAGVPVLELGISRACAERPAGYCMAGPEPQTQINRGFFFPKELRGRRGTRPAVLEFRPSLLLPRYSHAL